MADNNTDDLDLDLDADDADGAEGNADADGADDGADGSADDSKAGSGDKRIRDLQSRADAAEARANKAEQALQKALSRGEDKGSGPKDPEREALLSELREASLDAVFGENPELKAYGIDRSLIEGRTRAEMRESASALVTLIKAVETKAKNKALAEHGIKPEPAGSSRSQPKNYAEMSDEDIEKEIARSRSGGVQSLW